MGDPASGDLTIDAWVKTTALAGVQPHPGQASGDARSPRLRSFPLRRPACVPVGQRPGLAPTARRSPLSACTNWVATAPQGFVATGQWSFVAVTIQRSQPNGGTFYVNGIAVGTFDPTVRMGTLTNSGPTLARRLARDRRPRSPEYACRLSGRGSRSSNRALSAQEIQSIYKAGLPWQVQVYRSALIHSLLRYRSDQSGWMVLARRHSTITAVRSQVRCWRVADRKR